MQLKLVVVMASLMGINAWAGGIKVDNDLDRDFKADLCGYDRGEWKDGADSTTVYSWGYDGTTPVPGDYNSDGYVDLGVYDPANGAWYAASTDGAIILWGTRWGGFPGATPFVGDVDGDGIKDLIIYDWNTGKWYIRNLNGTILAWALAWGAAGSVPVPADYNNDGETELGVYNKDTGKWYICNLSGNVLANGIQWGGGCGVPVPGDYNGDGRTEIGVCFNNTDWYARDVNGTTTLNGKKWGFAGAMMITGDFNGDRKTDLGALSYDGTIEWNWFVTTKSGTALLWNKRFGDTSQAILGATIPMYDLSGRWDHYVKGARKDTLTIVQSRNKLIVRGAAGLRYFGAVGGNAASMARISGSGNTITLAGMGGSILSSTLVRGTFYSTTASEGQKVAWELRRR